MRKNTLHALGSLILLALLASCQQANKVGSYHIQGYLPGAPDGTQISLQVDQDQNLHAIQTTTVEQQHFTFTGKQDSTIECTVTYRLNGETLGATFFLENGDIHMNLGKETSSITGTTLNNKYQQFLDQINNLYAQIGAIYNETPADSLNEHQQEKHVRQMIRPIQQQANTLIFQTAKENNENAIGYYLLRRFQQELTTSQQEQLIDGLPVYLRRTTAIEDIRSQLIILPSDSDQLETSNLDEDEHYTED